MGIKEKILKKIHEAYDLEPAEKFRCGKSIDLTLVEVEKVIDDMRKGKIKADTTLDYKYSNEYLEDFFDELKLRLRGK